VSNSRRPTASFTCILPFFAGGHATFSVTNGTATGPYNGTFAANGTIDLHADFTADVSEQFTITSASPPATITGTKTATNVRALGFAAYSCNGGNDAVQLSLLAPVPYQAKISLATGGTYSDSGQSQVSLSHFNFVGAPPDKFLESFVSSNGVVPIGPATVTLSPATATNPVGTSHTVTATVDDATGQPVPNTTVQFTVAGAVNTTGSCTTGPMGECSFTYQGPTFPGADAITGCAGASGTPPCGAATKTWVLPVSTPGCATLITNGGWIIANNLDQASLGGNAQVPSSGPPEGQEQYTDHGPVTPMDVHSLNVLAVACNADNTQADIYGQATINQAGSHYYRISVADPDPTGAVDRYRIILDTSYDSGEHALGGGNIEIHR
jgi:hypothetical protein